ncbi:MAG: haloacid dehalogenase-like hydrolase [Elusimicrobia bacterium]|nr:haloacid dehalogenase-like hydrolase [Elusimicrobiota bacterium]
MKRTRILLPALCLLILAFSWSPAVGAKPHKKRRPAPASAGPSGAFQAPRKKRHKKAPPAVPKAPARPERVPLGAGRWTPEVRDAVERRLAVEGRGSPGYDENAPPAAVISLDDLSPAHSPGDALFAALVDSAAFKFNDGFWRRIPAPFGSERIRAGYNSFHRLSAAVWPKDDSYLMYRKAFYKARKDVCGLWGTQECARWKATLLTGFDEVELSSAAREAVASWMAGPVGVEKIGDYPEDPGAVELSTGLRYIPEVEALCRRLVEKGFEVWAMSSSDQWSAEVFARAYGIDAERVIGVRVKTASGTLTNDILSPVPIGSGQVEAFLQRIGQTPALVLGGAESKELIRQARLGIAFYGEDLPGFEPPKSSSGPVLVQPAFRPVRASQRMPKTVAETLLETPIGSAISVLLANGAIIAGKLGASEGGKITLRVGEEDKVFDFADIRQVNLVRRP